MQSSHTFQYPKVIPVPGTSSKPASGSPAGKPGAGRRSA